MGDLNLCISNGTVSIKIYDKRDDFDFDIVNLPFLDGDVPRRTSYGIYISQLVFVGFLSSWCLGRDAIGDCGTPWTFPLRKHAYLNI